MRTQPADFTPPKGSRYFSFRITRDDGRHEVSIGQLSNEQLRWVWRVIVAECDARTKKQEEAMVPANANET
jgi:hypothetical protein